MNKYLKILLFGFLIWLIPFLTAFLFYSSEGELTIDIFLFKSIMIVLGSTVGALLLVVYFKKIEKNYLYEGIIVGLAWFAVNIILDLIVLVPMAEMSIGNYFAEIGMRYLIIPVMSAAVGYIVESKVK